MLPLDSHDWLLVISDDFRKQFALIHQKKKTEEFSIVVKKVRITLPLSQHFKFNNKNDAIKD
jgi:hypothetical protein